MSIRSFFLAVACFPLVVFAQEPVEFPLVRAGGVSGTDAVKALLSRPGGKTSERLPVVVLLHSSWGWSEEGVTARYAEALNQAGFAALELRMFPNSATENPAGPIYYMPHLFGALRYLATRPDIDPRRIAVAGYSFGGMMAILSATAWANELYATEGHRFAAHASFYPVCWLFEANIKGRASPIPTEEWRKWSGAPVRIFAGALDDYDGQDPQACAAAVNALTDLQRSLFSVRVFEGATHGWDQTRSAYFFTKIGCKGKGCYNRNAQNREATRVSTQDLIEFLSRSMSSPN